MKLLKITLENFQGINYAEFDLGGRSAAIYGDNGTGKTTVYNAYTWLMSGVASTGAKGFTPKTVGTHNLDYSVSALIETDAGTQMLLRKTFHEVWKQKRGNPQPEFSGHTTDYQVDGVPKSEAEFGVIISQIAGDPDRIRMLSMLTYFPQDLKWQDRRQILLDICGDVTDADVITSSPELTQAGFMGMLLKPGTSGETYSVEDFKKIQKAQMTKINKDLDASPRLIDEATRAIPGNISDTAEQIQAQIDAAQKEADDIRTRIAANSSEDSARKEVQQRLSEAKVRFSEAKAAYLEDQTRENRDVSEHIAELRRSIADTSEEQKLRSDALTLEMDIRRMKATRDELMQQWTKVNSEVWDSSQGICPTCGRPFEEAQIEEMKANFNERRSQKLEAINQKAKACSKQVIAGKQDALDAANAKLEALKAQKDGVYEQINILQNTITEPKAFDMTQEGRDLSSKIAEISVEDANLALEVRRKNIDLDKELSDKNDEIGYLQKRLADIRTAERQKARIEELKEEQKSLAQAYADAEKKVHLCEVFTKTKVDLLDSRINSRFRTLRFRLFDEQINGGLKDCCDVLIPSQDGTLVPWAFANAAAKINAGLEIIETLGTYWNIHIPVFVDNAESVTSLSEYPDLQVIRLVVSEKDKKLRMEPAA